MLVNFAIEKNQCHAKCVNLFRNKRKSVHNKPVLCPLFTSVQRNSVILERFSLLDRSHKTFRDEMHFFWWLNLQFVFVRMQLQLPTLDCNSDFFDKVDYILCSFCNLEMKYYKAENFNSNWLIERFETTPFLYILTTVWVHSTHTLVEIYNIHFSWCLKKGMGI